MKTYTVYSPDEINFPLGIIDRKGNVLSGIRALDIIIANAKKGLANNKANNLLCARNIEQSEGKDVITLGELMGRPSKPKDRNFVCEVLKRQSCCVFKQTGDGNKVIDERVEINTPKIVKSGNRHMSKVDWESDRVKNQVQGLIAYDETLTFIANHLKVSRSALTKANKRLNYRFYIPKKKDNDDEIPEP